MLGDQDRERRAVEMMVDEQGRWYRALVDAVAVDWTGIRMPPQIQVKDETVREGEETPGVALTLDDKLRVCDALVQAGISEVEVGYCGAIREHHEFARELRRRGTPLRLSSHTRAYAKGDGWKQETDRGLDAGVDVINLLAKASSSQLALTPWLSKADVAERVHDSVSYSKKAGAFTAFGLADPARTSLHLVTSCYRAAFEAGADRLYVYDGPGCASPEAIAYLVTLVRGVSENGCEIAVHCHNDFGLAVANSIAAVRAGATVVDTVVNGMGDRAGNTPFEELVCSLEVLYGVKTGIDMSRIQWLSEMVSQVFGVPVGKTKPIVGENVYRHVSDSHVANILRGEWHSFEVIHPKTLGRKRSLEFGATTLHEGEGALSAKISGMGYRADPQLVSMLATRIRQELKTRPFVPEEEVEAMVRRLVTEVGG